MNFEQAIEHLKHGALIRRKGTTLWCWLGKSGRCYYGMKRDYPLQFRDSWLNSDCLWARNELKYIDVDEPNMKTGGIDVSGGAYASDRNYHGGYTE